MRVAQVGSGLSQIDWGQLVKGTQDFMSQADAAIKQAEKIVKDPVRASINKIEFINTLTQPLVYTADDILKAATAPPDPKSFTRFLKPTLVIDSPLFGKHVLAPYGEAKRNDWRVNFRRIVIGGGVALFTIFALSFGAGYMIGKKKGQ